MRKCKNCGFPLDATLDPKVDAHWEYECIRLMAAELRGMRLEIDTLQSEAR